MSIFSQKHTRESLASLSQYELVDLAEYYEIKIRNPLKMIDAILEAQAADRRRTALPVTRTDSIEDWL